MARSRESSAQIIPPWSLCLLVMLASACSNSQTSPSDQGLAATNDGSVPDQAVDANIVMTTSEALPNVFIPPYRSCVSALDDQPGQGPDGQVCTQVAISGATEPGRYFPDYAACDVVRTQRPFWVVPPAAEPDPADPRLQDADFMAELAWAKTQIEATGCVCCHDSRLNDGQVGQWDVAAEPIWITTLSDSGLALFSGLADSSVLGAYPPAENMGFDRTTTGIPTTDTARMQDFLRQVMDYRGLTEEAARAVPPFGGPIYTATITPPGVCTAQEGVTQDGLVQWEGGEARYLYVQTPEASNPGVPPNLDRPSGTLWRLDVRADQPPLSSGQTYGQAPEGSQQQIPDPSDSPPQLEPGQQYKLYVLQDVGVPIANCIFTFGAPEPPAAQEDLNTAVPENPASCATDTGFGTPCQNATDCGCPATDYCAISPGQSTGVCTASGCLDNPEVCPADWSCFDLSAFAAGEPAICIE